MHSQGKYLVSFDKVTTISRNIDRQNVGLYVDYRNKGCLEIINLVLQYCLVNKWLFKLINRDEVWQELRKKYMA